MSILNRAAISLAALLLLAGCAGQPEIPFDRGGTTSVNTIGLLTPGFPKGAGVVRASGVGQSFGLTGALVEAALQKNREDHFKEAITPQKFAAQQAFLKGVRSQLEQRGYTVVDIAQDRTDNALLTAYPTTASNPPVDAYLDLAVVSYGYIAAGITDKTPYRPTLNMRARLVGAKSNMVLMQDTIVYNLIGPLKNAITISPDEAYSFVDYDALRADPVNAVKGMQVSIDAATQTLGTLLK